MKTLRMFVGDLLIGDIRGLCIAVPRIGEHMKLDDRMFVVINVIYESYGGDVDQKINVYLKAI